jgi:hypothetical protein
MEAAGSAGNGRGHHAVIATGNTIRVLSCETKLALKPRPDAAAEWCDEYVCPDCGARFRVEWRDSSK